MRFLPFGLIWIFSALTLPTFAHDNGMVMSMDGAMSLTSPNMVPYLHFTPGDTIWFFGWVPESVGAMIGTCIGLFLLAIAERWLTAIHATAKGSWLQQSKAGVPVDDRNVIGTASMVECDEGEKVALFGLTRAGVVPTPSITARDFARGILYSAHAALGFALMLVVMTYQVAFIIAIVVGFGVGEAMFGRHSSVMNGH